MTVGSGENEGGGLRYRTAQAHVASALRGLILSGEIPPGTRLLQTELAERFSTSTTPIREALRQLAGEGLLDGDPHHSVVVHEPTVSELDQIYEIRICLEQLEAEWAVRELAENQLQRAQELVESMDRVIETSKWTELNFEFHKVLTVASRARLASLLHGLRTLSALYVARSIKTAEERKDANREHRMLLEAYRARDVDAAKAAVRTHLEHTVEICRAEMTR